MHSLGTQNEERVVEEVTAGWNVYNSTTDVWSEQVGMREVAVPRHMTPCACHRAACRAAGHGNTCGVLQMGLLWLFQGKTDIVDLVVWHYHGASGWATLQIWTHRVVLSYHFLV
jgi:hypothetical protein